jgi:hypothetical protein
MIIIRSLRTGEASNYSPEGTSNDPSHKNITLLDFLFLFGGNLGFPSSGTTDPFASGTVTHKTATKDRKLSTVHQKILVAEHFSHTYCSGF